MILSIQLNSETISALIALIGVIISVGISLIIALWNNRYNYRQLYAQTVSENRMEWINIWRENISKFLACAETLHNNRSYNSDEIIKMEKELYEARGMVVSRLNLTEADHLAMLTLINSFTIHCSDEDFVKQREAILALARKILKPEWERLKDEAKGHRYGK